MATLKQLESEFQRIQGDLTSYEQQKETTINELKSAKLSIKDLNSSIKDLNNRMTALDTVIRSESDDSMRSKLSLEKDEVQKELQAAIDERTRLSQLITNKTDAEKNISEATENLNKIIADFASDPRINAHLVEGFEINYDNEIENTEKEKSDLVTTSKKLSLDLKDEKVFAPLVRNLVESYNEYKKLPAFILDAETEKKASDAKLQLRNSQDALTSAISQRAEYANIQFSVEDLEAIVAGPNTDGEYKFSTLEEEIENKAKVSEELTNRKEKTIEYIKSLQVAEKVDDKEVKAKLEDNDTKYKAAESKEVAEKNEIARLAKEIEALKATFTASTATQADKDSLDAIKTKIATLNSEISAIETKLGALGFDQTELDKLNDKAKVPDELTKKEESAQNEYDKAVKVLKSKGYIGKSVYPELADENSEASKKFAAFREADQAVRQAFLECQTSADGEKAKENLKKAMENYKTVSGELTAIPGMQGLTVENWHNYLVRTLENEQDKGEVLGEEYIEGTMDGKLSGIKSTYKKEFSKNKHTVSDKFDEVSDVSKELVKMQESFLKGEKDDAGNDKVTYDSAEAKVDDFRSKFKDLFEGLKNAGAKGLEKIEDLFGKIAGKIAKIGIFNRIKNFFTRNKASQNIIGGMNEEDRDEIDDLVASLKNKKADLENAQTEVKDARNSKLSEEEIKKLAELEAKAEQRDILIDEREEKNQENQQLEGEAKDLEDKINNSQKTATPEEQAKLTKLETEQSTHQQELEAAQQSKVTLAEERKALEEERNNLKSYRPEVVKNAKGIAHGQAQGLQAAAKKAIDDQIDDR
jgi:hypothetical protein